MNDKELYDRLNEIQKADARIEAKLGTLVEGMKDLRNTTVAHDAKLHDHDRTLDRIKLVLFRIVVPVLAAGGGAVLAAANPDALRALLAAL